jgi:type I restriction enzyme S subunit
VVSRREHSPTVRIGNALRLINGRAFKPSEWKRTGVPIVRIQNLNNPDAPFNYYEGDLPDKFLLDDGDLLFAWSGTPGTSFGAHIWRGGKAWLNQHIFKVHFEEMQFDKRYLQLAINRNLEEYIRAAHGGAGLAHITKGRFEESSLPCPPVDEQRRIVADIEKQFTRLDAGVVSLKRVQTELGRYRASVLKAACEGRLVPTEAELARKENRGYETGEQLLERILKLRREKWNGKGKYKEPIGPNTVNLLSLPTGWTWAGTEELTAGIDNAITIGPFGSNLMVKDYRESGVPLIFVREIRSDNFRRSDTRYISREKADELASHKVRGGDLVITKMGEPPGDPAIYPSSAADAIATSDCIKLTPNKAGTSAIFLKHAIRGQPVKDQIERITRGVAQKKVSLARFKTVAIPLPPLAEQQRIVAEVERRLSVIKELEAVLNANIQRATRLRQSTLQTAFTGKLLSDV